MSVELDPSLPPDHGDPIEATPYSPPPGWAPRSARRGFRVGRVLFVCALALLLLLGWHVLSARWVRVEVSPVPDRLSLSGGWLPIPVNRGYLLHPGYRYRLNAEKAGYRRLEAALVPTAEAHQLFSFSLRKLPGRLRVGTRPVAGARVAIAGQARGETPLLIPELEPGDYRVTLQKERFLPVETQVEIAGMGKEQRLEVELKPDWAPVSVAAIPSGTGLWVDGQDRGVVPARLELRQGYHQLMLRLAGYKEWQKEIEVVAGQAVTLPTVELQVADGVLHLSSDPDRASVTLNGVYQGQTPLEVPVPVGKPQRLSLSKRGYRSLSREVRMAAAEHRDLELALKPVMGRLKIAVEPADARLYVDGKAHGAVRELSLPGVPHRIEVRRKGYRTYRTRVTPQAGFTREIRVSLESLERPAAGTKNEARGKGSATRPLLAPDGQRLRRIEPGRFRMGASRREQGRRGNEVQREAILTRPFYLGEKEVTNAQFRRFLSSHSSGSFNGLDLDADPRPVVNVTWNNAAAYCNWLSHKAGLPLVYERRHGHLEARRPLPDGYRLPSEAEWAWAARMAGRSRPRKYPWGDKMPPTPGSGNYADQSDASYLANTLSEYNDGFAATAPPGRFRASPAGLYDLSGNVAEWVNDYYAIEEAGAGEAVRDPLGPATGMHHVVRGSSWMSSSIGALRWTYRDYSKKPRADLGFRIARNARNKP